MTHHITPLVHDTTSWHVDIRELAAPMPSPDRWADAVREISAHGIEVREDPPAVSWEVQMLLQRVAEGIHPI